MDKSYSFINPVIFKIGFFELRWYSIAYILGFVVAYFLLLYSNKYCAKKDFLSREKLDSLMNYLIFSVILGGRAGYILFYEPIYYLKHPFKVFALWEGGMSFHGGIIGVGLGIFFFCKAYKIKPIVIMDKAAFSCTPGLFFGRIANFINGELWGNHTSQKFGFIFPASGDLLLRHPSQLYEAFFEGVVIFTFLLILLKMTKGFRRYGLFTASFLLLYSIFRFLIEEFFREAHNSYSIFGIHLSTGQILSFPLFVIGIITLLYAFHKKKITHPMKPLLLKALKKTLE